MNLLLAITANQQESNCDFRPNIRNPKKGAFAKGRRANLLQPAHQICAKLPAFRLVHPRRVRKIVANLKVNFGQFYANSPFPMPPSPDF